MKGGESMELLINKRIFAEQGKKESSIVEPVARMPYEPGVHETEIGPVELAVGKFNSVKGTEKVVVKSGLLSSKKSGTRRVVEFSQRYERVIAHDISPTVRYEFSRRA